MANIGWSGRHRNTWTKLLEAAEMATNPKYPQFPEKDRAPEKVSPVPVDDHAKVDIIKKGKFPWPLIAIIVAVAILIALIIWLPSIPQRNPPPSAAQVPQQPTASQIQLTNVNIAPAPVGSALYVAGVLHNQGPTAITGVQVRADFLAAHGQIIGSQSRPLEEVSGNAETNGGSFAGTPIQPNQARPFRVYFDHIPQTWNHQVPALTVTTVTGTTPS